MQYEQTIAEMLKELNEKVVNQSIVNKLTKAEMIITNLRVAFNPLVKHDSLRITIANGAESHSFADMRFAQAYDDNKTLAILREMYDKIDALVNEQQEIIAAQKRQEAEMRYAEQQRLQAEQQRLQEENEKKEKEMKALKRRADYIKTLEQFIPSVDASEFDSDTIQFLHENITSINAKMPSDIEHIFVKVFGATAVHTVIDANKRTSGGNKMQQSFSFFANLKNAEYAPASIQKYIHNKKLSSVDYIWHLVKNYDFKFGKQAD